jgi:HEAT repeat protein
LLAATTDADQAVRQAAARVLGEIKGAETVTPLLTALKTKDETVGDHASETLAKLGHSAVTPLLTAMKDEDRRVRTRAAEALTKIGTAAVGPLLEALQDKRRDVRQSAAEALAKAGDRWAVEPLVTMLWDPDSDVRQAAAESLAALGWQPMDAIERARETVARRAWPTAATLGMAAVEPLQDALQDRRQDVRRGAAEALKMLGWQSTGTPVRLWLAIAFDKTSEAVALGADAVEPLLAVLERWDAEGRLKAAEILGQIRDVRVVKALVGLTNDPQVAETAMQALQRILQASSTAVDTEDLRRVVALDRVVQARRQIRTSRGIVYIRGATAPIDCAYLRQLAQQELQRRGIQV